MRYIYFEMKTAPAVLIILCESRTCEAQNRAGCLIEQEHLRTFKLTSTKRAWVLRTSPY